MMGTTLLFENISNFSQRIPTKWRQRSPFESDSINSCAIPYRTGIGNRSSLSGSDPAVAGFDTGTSGGAQKHLFLPPASSPESHNASNRTTAYIRGVVDIGLHHETVTAPAQWRARHFSHHLVTAFHYYLANLRQQLRTQKRHIGDQHLPYRLVLIRKILQTVEFATQPLHDEIITVIHLVIRDKVRWNTTKVLSDVSTS